jgi:hypothetical protein
VSVNLGFLDTYPEQHRAELLREADMERLAHLATSPRRPLRARLAERVFAVAEWLEGTQPRSTVGSEA